MFNLYIDETFVCAYIESFANTGCFFKIFQTFWIAYVKIALFNNCGRKKNFLKKLYLKKKQDILLDDLVVRGLFEAVVTQRDNAEIDSYISRRKCTVCETNVCIEETLNLMTVCSHHATYVI